MSIPVDEMLSELRQWLELFDIDPSLENFDGIIKETRRIEHACEEALPE